MSKDFKYIEGYQQAAKDAFEYIDTFCMSLINDGKLVLPEGMSKEQLHTMLVGKYIEFKKDIEFVRVGFYEKK